ncbi:uncharacterized protein LOC113229979 [Hyposmocoma kahamanoa]|uniref:uncharacterized protein LOC113229979 n=1 Tax=Hyposmocoma kahamanoa TaxID=1477025 RepID=UPI000E6D7435|nr:uncharacterized protein LOC113229979 [Hyposmocoma kahamanoa]
MLADFLRREGSSPLGAEGMYKMTYKEAADELMKAQKGKTAAQDQKKQAELHGKINLKIPDEKAKELLQDTTTEGAAHIADVIKGRGEAMEAIHQKMKETGNAQLVDVGGVKKSYKEGAEMLTQARTFVPDAAPPSVASAVIKNVEKLEATPKSALGQEHLKDTQKIVGEYIAGQVAKESAATARVGAPGARPSGAGATNVPDAGAPGTGAAGAGAPEVGGPGGVGLGAGASRTSGLGGSGTGYETEAQRKKREEEEDRLKAEAEELLLAQTDPERYNCLQLLYKALLARAAQNFHGTPPISLTHQQAYNWLKLRKRIDKSISNSPDTDRLSKKFEKKLAELVVSSTPEDLRDVMQDVIIESSHKLAEYFVSANYKETVKTLLISEMQRKGNELLIENNSGAESYFYAAQRLKLEPGSLDANEPCFKIAYDLTKKLEDMMRHRTMPRKYAVTAKEHVREVADYLSPNVTKRHENIEAYVDLLAEMESTGDKLLVEGEIPKSYKDSAAYLRRLTSFQDKICQPNSSLQSDIEGKLKTLMSNAESRVQMRSYGKSVMDNVITENTRLLVSYITLQGNQ